MGYIWKDITSSLNHWHKIPTDKIDKSCPAILKKAEGQNLYQISIGKKSRLIGFRVKDIFYIVAYDKNHNIYSMS